jgi:hypothetical protein
MLAVEDKINRFAESKLLLRLSIRSRELMIRCWSYIQ